MYQFIYFSCECLNWRSINLTRGAGVETDKDEGGEGDGQSVCPAGDLGHTVHWQGMPSSEKSDNLGDEMLIQNTLNNATVLVTNHESGMAITQL